MVTANPMLPSNTLRRGDVEDIPAVGEALDLAPALMVIPPNRTSLIRMVTATTVIYRRSMLRPVLRHGA
jgi:hypothetical protein